MGNATHLAKDSVLAIEVGRRHCGDKELAAVGVGASVGHGQHARSLQVVTNEKAQGGRRRPPCAST